MMADLSVRKSSQQVFENENTLSRKNSESFFKNPSISFDIDNSKGRMTQ
jgi:hypothetical protein